MHQQPGLFENIFGSDLFASLDLAGGFSKQLFHMATYAVFRDIDTFGLQISPDLAENIFVAGFFKIRGDDVTGIGRSIVP